MRWWCHRQWNISIHTLRMEGDAPTKLESYKAHISIHTLRVEGDSKSAQKSRTLLFKVTDLRRNCRPDVHERTEGSSFADRFYMVSFIFVVRRCPETTGHFWFAPAQRVLLSAVLHHQDAFRLVAGISSEMLYFLFILIA